MSAELFQALARSGARVFKTEDARLCSQEIDFNLSYVNEALFHLKKKGWIHALHKGLYALSSEFLSGAPLHEYEIAMQLVHPSAISHFSALSFYGLTDQPVQDVSLLAPFIKGAGRSSRSRYVIKGVTYHVVRIHPKFYHGIEKKWTGETPFWITDLERTLIETVIRPRFCGGFREVLFAFEKAGDQIKSNKILEYTKIFSVAVAKRLGWIFQKLHDNEALVENLRHVPARGFHKLDPSGPSVGTLNKEWNLLENIGGGL